MLALRAPTDETGPTLATLWKAELGNYATALDWSSDGALCAVGSASGEVSIFDGKSGALHARLPAHPGGVLALAWCPGKRCLATAGQDGRARLYNAGDGALLATLPGVAAWVEHLAWSPDGKTLATSSGKVVRLWRANGAPLLETEPHRSTVTGLAWNRKGTQLATACYGGLNFWAVRSGAKARTLPFQGSLISLAWSPDDKVIACGSQDCSVHFWRLSTGNDSAMQGYPSKPRSLAWDTGATLLATGGEATITVWKFSGRGPEGSTPILLAGHEATITDLVFSRRGSRLASGAKDARVIVWEPRQSTEPVAVGSMNGVVSHVRFRPNHDQITGVDASGRVVTWAIEPLS